MAEYVCNLIPDDPDVPYDSDDYSGECIRRELVVRCRDCVHWRRPSDREKSRCTGAMAFVEPTPDGFCSWAKGCDERVKRPAPKVLAADDPEACAETPSEEGPR